MNRLRLRLTRFRVENRTEPDLKTLLAMQARYGISYKEAVHRLFLAELQKIAATDLTNKEYYDLLQRFGIVVANLDVEMQDISGLPKKK